MTFFDRVLTECWRFGARSVWGRRFTRTWFYLGVSGVAEEQRWKMATRLAGHPHGPAQVTVGEDTSE